MKAKKSVAAGVGMPAWIYLQDFGEVLRQAFGAEAYLVGSALHTRKWRDVDVRVMLSDEDWEKWGFGDAAISNAKWAAHCKAFSELGKKMTGLPIDFQLQQTTYANQHFKGWRSALGIIYKSEKVGIMVTVRFTKTELEMLILWGRHYEDLAKESKLPFEPDEKALMDKLREHINREYAKKVGDKKP